MDINRTISNFNFFDTETTLNGNFNPKSAIISINTYKKKKIFRFLLTTS